MQTQDHVRTRVSRIAELAVGVSNKEARACLKKGLVSPLPNPQGGFRPLLLTHISKRCARRALTKLEKPVNEAMVGDMHYGVGCSDGAGKLETR